MMVTLILPSIYQSSPSWGKLSAYTSFHGAWQGELYLPSCDHELFLRCFLPDLGVDVHGEEGAGAVEDGGQGAHERGQHDR